MILPRKMIFLLLVSGSLCFNAFSQEQRTVKTMQVTASATVTDNLQLITMRDIDLINPPLSGTMISVLPQESAYAGLFRVEGSASALVRVTYVSLETLQEAGGNGGEVIISYRLSGNKEDNQQQSILYAASGEFDIQLGRDGRFFIWLGGELDISRALPGDYYSEFIIELEYT